jgi:hypothetical protein
VSRVIGLAAVLAALLTACTTARPMMAPSGSQGLKIWCEMPSQCYERAAKECPYGYTIEANEKDYWGLGDIDGNLFIVCKRPGDAPTPVSNGSTPSSQGSKELDPAKRCDACERIGRPG